MRDYREEQLFVIGRMSPSDFIMEGFYRDGKDGMTERPGDGESTVSWEGKPLPYLPFAYRHPEYWQKMTCYGTPADISGEWKKD